MDKRAEFIAKISIMIEQLDAAVGDGDITSYEYYVFTSMCDSAAILHDTKKLMLIKDIIAATMALHEAEGVYIDYQSE